jgi:hypothetical protein
MFDVRIGTRVAAMHLVRAYAPSNGTMGVVDKFGTGVEALWRTRAIFLTARRRTRRARTHRLRIDPARFLREISHARSDTT